MKFRADVPNFGIWSDPRRFADFAARLEAAGWGGISVWDHILVKDGMEVADPWVLLTAAAMVTDRIKLMSMVTPIPRRPPWKLAREYVSVDIASEGRLILGVGIGWPTDPSSPDSTGHRICEPGQTCWMRGSIFSWGCGLASHSHSTANTMTLSK